MIPKYLLTVFFLVTLVIGSIFKKTYRVEPLKNLKIDHNKFRFGTKKINMNLNNLRPPCYVHESLKEFDPDDLYFLYYKAETGIISFFDPLYVTYEEIFAKNKFYTFTPAEWALYNGHVEVLEYFITTSLKGSTCFFKRVKFFMKNLAVLAIQYKNFRALRLCVETADFNLDYDGFLTLATQHRATEEMLNYLLEDCGCRKELSVPLQTDLIIISPLEASVKFNNVQATKLFLSKGAPFGARACDCHDKSILALLFAHDRKLMFDNILRSFPSFCYYVDFEGDGLLHYAAHYAKNPEIITFLLNYCPNLNVNSLDKSDRTPIAVFLQGLNPDRSNIAIKFIKMGADLLSVTFKQLSPIETIINYNYVQIFEYIIQTQSHDNVLMKKIIELIFKKESWKFLEMVLEVRQNIPINWIDLDKMNFDDLLEDRNLSLFRIALQLNVITINSNIVEMIIEANSSEFLREALQYGANFEMISEETITKLQETRNYEMLYFIQKYTRERITNFRISNIEELPEYI